MRASITVRLVGGLGNQLFGYYAGAALAARSRSNLRIDTSYTRHGLTDHGIEILNFDLPGRWLGNDSLKARLFAPHSLGGSLWNMIGSRVPWIHRIFRIYETGQPGHDPQLLSLPPGTRLRGYFQSWRIAQAAVESGYPRRPALRVNGYWVSSHVKRATRERPVAVHVRRGDYVRIGERLLGPAYYERAIGMLRSEGIHGPIWVFSDEPEVAREVLGKYAGEAEVISSPEGAATEMTVMSYAAANIIANSTFSWWGAWMNQESEMVVTPDNWFNSGLSREDLMPPGWRRMPVS